MRRLLDIVGLSLVTLTSISCEDNSIRRPYAPEKEVTTQGPHIDVDSPVYPSSSDVNNLRKDVGSTTAYTLDSATLTGIRPLPHTSPQPTPQISIVSPEPPPLTPTPPYYPTPIPSGILVPTPQPTISPYASSTSSPIPLITPTPTPIGNITPTPSTIITVTPTPSPSPIRTPTPSLSPVATRGPTPSPLPTYVPCEDGLEELDGCGFLNQGIQTKRCNGGVWEPITPCSIESFIFIPGASCPAIYDNTATFVFPGAYFTPSQIQERSLYILDLTSLRDTIVNLNNAVLIASHEAAWIDGLFFNGTHLAYTHGRDSGYRNHGTVRLYNLETNIANTLHENGMSLGIDVNSVLVGGVTTTTPLDDRLHIYDIESSTLATITPHSLDVSYLASYDNGEATYIQTSSVPNPFYYHSRQGTPVTEELELPVERRGFAWSGPRKSGDVFVMLTADENTGTKSLDMYDITLLDPFAVSTHIAGNDVSHLVLAINERYVGYQITLPPTNQQILGYDRATGQTRTIWDRGNLELHCNMSLSGNVLGFSSAHGNPPQLGVILYDLAAR